MFSIEPCHRKQENIRYSACQILTDFIVHNKRNCKIITWSKLTLRIAKNTAYKNIENRFQTKQIINTTCKIILQNTKTALQHTDI